jgi:fructose-bisphosphate aldolase, class II
MNATSQIMQNAQKAGTVIPAFNIPYLPMMSPVVRALRDTNCFGLIAVARPDWEKFGAISIRAVRDEYDRVRDERFTRLHLDHVPVIDEDGLRVDFEAIIREALQLGYHSVMVDGSRLALDENIRATRKVVEMAHESGVPVEAELGAVMGHEEGPLPKYDELFATGKGFTDPHEAKRFVDETGADWLSVAVGSIHGAISDARKHQKKIEARLDIRHLDRISRTVGIPLVLHGGSGIQRSYIMESIRHGIAKINIATAIRQPYETAVALGSGPAREAVYQATRKVIRDDLGIENSADKINPIE